MSASKRMDRFLAFSAEVTAFSPYELRGTGMAETYLDTAIEVVGDQTVDDLLDAYDKAPASIGKDRALRDAHLRLAIFGDAKLGPVARNIIKLWYVGIWYELPRAWIEAYGASPVDFTQMASAQAYTEGLLWPAIGANPPGAKAPGFASWVGPPQIPSF